MAIKDVQKKGYLKAREKSDAKLVDDIEAVNTRHLKTLRAIQAKALSALQSLPLTSGMNAVRALDLAIKAERGIMQPVEGRGRTLEDILAASWKRNERPPVEIQVITGVPRAPPDEDQ